MIGSKVIETQLDQDLNIQISKVNESFFDLKKFFDQIKTLSKKVKIKKLKL